MVKLAMNDSTQLGVNSTNSELEWSNLNSSNGLFSLKFPQKIHLIQDGFGGFGDSDGVLCNQNSNWREVQEDSSGDLHLEGCIIYSTLSTNGKINTIDQYSQIFFTESVGDTGDITYQLINKQKIQLGNNEFVRAIYDYKNNLSAYEYVVMSPANKIIHFSFLGGQGEIDTTEEILATLVFLSN